MKTPTAKNISKDEIVGKFECVKVIEKAGLKKNNSQKRTSIYFQSNDYENLQAIGRILGVPNMATRSFIIRVALASAAKMSEDTLKGVAGEILNEESS